MNYTEQLKQIFDIDGVKETIWGNKQEPCAERIAEILGEAIEAQTTDEQLSALGNIRAIAENFERYQEVAWKIYDTDYTATATNEQQEKDDEEYQRASQRLQRVLRAKQAKKIIRKMLKPSARDGR